MIERAGRVAPPATPETVPPYDLEAEKSVLGACMVSKKAFQFCASRLESEDFFAEQNRIIFAAIKESWRESEEPDRVLIRGKLSTEYDKLAVDEILLSSPNASNVIHHVKTIIESKRDRDTINVCSRAIQEIYAGGGASEDAAGKAMKGLESVCKRQGAVDATQPLGVAFEAFEHDVMASHEVSGIRTGIPKLDALIQGIENGMYYVIAGRPGMGKTLVITQLLITAARQNKRVYLCLAEGIKRTFLRRAACSVAGVSLGKLQRGQLTKDEKARVVFAGQQLAKLTIFVNDSGNQSVADIRRDILRHEPDIAFVDYLGRLKPADMSEPRYLQVSRISADLDSLKQEFDIGIVVAAQLSRAVEQRPLKDRRPIISDLRDSGTIEQDADFVIMPFREKYYNEEAPDTIEFHVEKNRYGDVFGVTERIDPVSFWIGSPSVPEPTKTGLLSGV